MTHDFEATGGMSHPGSIGEEAFREISRVFDAAQPRRILEFGSGASTAALAERFPGARVESYESNASFFSDVSGLLAERGLSGRVDLILSPLRFRLAAGGWFLTYGSVRGGDPVDCILIDGPRTVETLRGREACLYLSFARLRIGGVVVLDDFNRDDERRIAANWEAAYPGVFSKRAADAGHGLLILTKNAEARPRMTAARALDNARACAVLGLKALWRFIRKHFPLLADFLKFVLKRR